MEHALLLVLMLLFLQSLLVNHWSQSAHTNWTWSKQAGETKGGSTTNHILFLTAEARRIFSHGPAVVSTLEMSNALVLHYEICGKWILGCLDDRFLTAPLGKKARTVAQSMSAPSKAHPPFLFLLCLHLPRCSGQCSSAKSKFLQISKHQRVVTFCRHSSDVCPCLAVPPSTVNGSDNGAISHVIQSTNQSRVLSSRPRADVRPKGKDTRPNPEHKLEQKR